MNSDERDLRGLRNRRAVLMLRRDSETAMDTVPVRANFLDDIRRQLADRMQRSGIVLPGAATVDDVALTYFDFRRRQISARPRTVHRSAELLTNPVAVTYKRGLDAIIEDAETGKTLVPYFTEGWMNLEVHDFLFNDWNIVHMHLGGRRMKCPCVVERTGPVLFAFLADRDLYLIDVMPHGKSDPTAFAKKQLVQILHDNWGKMMERHRFEGVSNVEPNDDHSRWLLSRRRGTAKKPSCKFGMAVEVADGTVYGAMGGGMMSTGVSMEARRRSDSLLNHAVRLQKHWQTHANMIRDKILKGTGTALDELHLKLELRLLVGSQVRLRVREEETNLYIEPNAQHPPKDILRLAS
jgi:hypothetical protein